MTAMVESAFPRVHAKSINHDQLTIRGLEHVCGRGGRSYHPTTMQASVLAVNFAKCGNERPVDSARWLRNLPVVQDVSVAR